MSTFLQTRRSCILDAINAMPATINPDRRRLDRVTRAFLDLPLFSDAVRHGWSDRELFAVDPARCSNRQDRAGLISGIALTKLNSPKVLSIGAHSALIECGTKTNRSRLAQARVAETYLGCCWWHSPELGGLPETSAQEIAA